MVAFIWTMGAAVRLLLPGVHRLLSQAVTGAAIGARSCGGGREVVGGRLDNARAAAAAVPVTQLAQRGRQLPAHDSNVSHLVVWLPGRRRLHSLQLHSQHTHYVGAWTNFL